MRERRQFKRLASSYWTVGLLLVVIVFLSYTFSRGLRDWWRERERFEETERKVRELEAEKTRLEREIAYFSNEANRTEEAKKTLGLVEPGEELAIFVPKETSTNEERANQGGWWGKLLKWLR